MLRRVAVVAAALLVPFVVAGIAEAEPGGCAVIDGTGQCLVRAADPGRPGGPQDPARAARPAAPAGRAAPEAISPEFLQQQIAGKPAIDGLRAGLPQQPTPNGPAPAAVAQARAAVLAQQAVEQLTLQPPAIRTSTPATAFVGVPLWLWIERGAQFTGPVSTTASAGTAQVTATGKLVGVEWSMGPPGADVKCVGPGTPWNGQRGPSPDCGYVYTARSLPERTGGTGKWTITATSVWQVNWAGNSDGVPVDGAQTVRVSSQSTLPVGEVQVLVSGGGQ